MGYFNIIDSLSDKRVDEGMVSSISKNTNMYRSGVTYYDSNRDIYCKNTKEALDMIFSYCADSFCSSLSRSDITDALGQFDI